VTHLDDNLRESITFLAGDSTVFESVSPQRPFSGECCGFLEAVSRELRNRSDAAGFPDIASFAFWCRKGNIARLKSSVDDGRYRLGRGRVFHIAPSNVPVNFAFSFVFGLLAGCNNVVRVPSKEFPQVEILAGVFNKLLKTDDFVSLRQHNALIRYERNDEITRWISERSDGRIIWGGDTTIRTIRKFPIRPRGVEIGFADRYSFSVLEGNAIAALSEIELAGLAKSFYNDTYIMDQNACSSPHLVVWLGGANESVRHRFWEQVAKTATGYDLPAVKVMDKYTRLCSNGITFGDGNRCCHFRRWGNRLYVVELAVIPEQLDSLRGLFGLFYEYNARSLDDLAEFVNDKFQTVTTFGVDRKLIADWVVRRSLTGIDRVVPVGSALDIGIVWDGFELVNIFSRMIDC